MGRVGVCASERLPTPAPRSARVHGGGRVLVSEEGLVALLVTLPVPRPDV